MVNWPQQFRALEVVVDDATGEGKIIASMINHQSEAPHSVSNRGRFLSYIEAVVETFRNGRTIDQHLSLLEGAPKDRNAILNFRFTPGMLTEIGPSPISLSLGAHSLP